MSSGGTTYLLHIKLSQIIICQQMKVFLRVSFHNSVGISVPTLTVPTLTVPTLAAIKLLVGSTLLLHHYTT